MSHIVAIFNNYNTMCVRIPFDIWSYIFNMLDGDILSQLRLRSVCKEFYQLQITDLHNIESKYKQRLNDKILKTFKHVKLLNISGNNNITDEGIKHMMLHTFDPSGNRNITDNGIKHMMLHTLSANVTNITDEGIKHMMLHALDISPYITDEGIKHMNLYYLHATATTKITDEGIRHMKLHTLYISYFSGITEDGIKDMKLHTLCTHCNKDITYEIVNGIKTLK
jgi:hypothetical protein